MRLAVHAVPYRCGVKERQGRRFKKKESKNRERNPLPQPGIKDKKKNNGKQKKKIWRETSGF